MIIQKIFFLLIFPLFLWPISLSEQFEKKGYIEIGNKKPSVATFDSLYAYFDHLTRFLQTNPVWAQKLYKAKERFIRSKDRSYYSTDVFGFYDESDRRNQISFYYSVHFHGFICSHYPEFNQVSEIINFFEACFEIQKPCGHIFSETAAELGPAPIPFKVLFKVIKYLPSYSVKKPHYDGTAFSLFLDSTDNQSLLLSPYKSSFTTDDFLLPIRAFSDSILLIPGAHLTEFSIYPTPHIVLESGRVRYAAIAFAMRPNYIPEKIEHSPLPIFRD